jgi:pleiotropic regulator 1
VPHLMVPQTKRTHTVRQPPLPSPRSLSPYNQFFTSHPSVFHPSTMSVVLSPEAEAGPSTNASLPPLSELVKRSVKRTRAVYGLVGAGVDDGLTRALVQTGNQLTRRNKIKMASKLAAEYRDVQTLPPVLQSQGVGPAGPKRPLQASVGIAGPDVKLIGGPEQPPP